MTASSGWPRRYAKYVAVVLAAILAAGAWLWSRPPDYRHVILISLDTVRADHLACYGHPFIKTPNIDALAAAGIRFQDATTVAPTTLASHTSIMTGTYPHTHGVARNGFMVHSENVMLAESLAAAGFETAAVIGSFALDARFDFSQGFEHFDQSFDITVAQDRVDQNQRRADKVTDAAIALLDRMKPGRLFLFVHYFDAHAPYDPPPPFDQTYAGAAPSGARTLKEGIDRAIARQQQAVTGRVRGKSRTIAEGLERELLTDAPGLPLGDDAALDALYCGEIAFIDLHLGRLIANLKKSGIYDQAIVIVTADHGETMWEHGDFWNHGLWVYDTTVRVPLLMRLPANAHAGAVVSQSASTIDIVPSVLELLELPLPPGIEGASLVRTWTGEDLHRDAVFSEATQPYGAVEKDQAWPNALKPKCVRSGRWKYIDAAYLDLQELYDLVSDPGERVNLLRQQPAEHADRAAALRRRLHEWTATARPLPSQFNPEQNEEVIRQLRSLGYVGDQDP